LVGLIVNADEAPRPGEKAVVEGREVAEVTSSCVSPTLGKTIALAYVRREFTEPGAKLTFASGVTAVVAALPFISSAKAEQPL
jgi:aminomethyltransferase